MFSALSAAQLAVLFKGDVSGLQQVLAQAESGIDRFGSRTTNTLRGVNKEAKDTGMTMERLANGIKGAFVGGSVAVGLITLKNQITAATGAIVEAQVQVDRLRNGFKFGAGGAEGGARELQFVREEAKRLGLELNGTANQYMKMVAASRGSAMAGQQTRDVFQAIAEASVVMGMGADQSERSFMAVTQMMSKGKIMAEELRGQLGEHLPGAFSIAARAMGVTEVELNKMLETGQVFSADFLPKFAAQLRKELAGSVEESSLSMQASLNRLSTSWQRFKQEVAEGGVGDFIGGQVAILNDAIGSTADRMEMARRRGEGFGGMFYELAAGAASFLNPLNAVSYSARDNANAFQAAEERYAYLKKQLEGAPNNLAIKIEIARTEEYIATLRVAQAEQAKLLGGQTAGVIGSVGSGDTALARAQRADYDKRNAARGALLKQYATPGERLSEELGKQRKLLGDLFTPDLEKRITEHFIKPSKGAAREAEKSRKAFGELYNKLTMKDVGLDPDFYADLNTLHKGYQAGKITLEEYRGAVESLINTQKFAKDAADAALKATLAAAESNNAAFDEVFNAREKEREAVEERIKAGRVMLEDLQFETSLLKMNTQEREVAVAMRDLERKGVIEGTEAYKAYAEQVKAAIADRQRTQAMVDMWADFEGAARDVFMDIAENGEDAFKRIGQSIKREVLQMLYEMTVKKWIIQVAGSYGGGISGGGNSWVDMASQAYSAYTGNGGGSLGSLFGGGGAASTYSLASGTTSTGLTAGSSGVGLSAGSTGASGMTATATTSTSTGAAAGGGTSLMAYAGYAALIYAAVKYAESLYAKGYNRSMLEGRSQSYTFGTGNTTSGYTDDAGYKYTPYKYRRQMLEAMGMSEKWADILSSTTRWAHMFGRKLSGYGYNIGINGGNVDVGGYETYKSGWAGRLLGRGSKTMSVDIDSRDAQSVQMQVQSVREAAKAMAGAMGLSAGAIDEYTGKLKVNFKGANTAAEQSERMAEAMDKLQYALMKAASGGKMAKAEFERLMADVTQRLEGVGITGQGMADILAQGMTGRLSQAQVGEQLGEMVIGGVYNMIVSPFAQQISQAFLAQIIQPMVVAVTTGGSISAAVSQATIQSVVAQANAAAAQLTAILSDPAFRAAMAGIQQAITGISAASVQPARAVRSYGSALNRTATAANNAREAAQRLRDSWSGLFDGLINEVRRLRGEILGTSEAGSAYNMAQFASATAAARAGSQQAFESLPELSRAVEESYRMTAQSRADLQAIRGYLLESNQITAGVIAGRFGFAIPAFADGGDHLGGLRLVGERGPELESTGPARYWSAEQTQRMLGGGSDPALLAELRALRSEVAALRAEAKRGADASAAGAAKVDEIAKGRWTLRTEVAA